MYLFNIHFSGGSETNISAALWQKILDQINAADQEQLRRKSEGVKWKDEVIDCSTCHANNSARQPRDIETVTRGTKFLDRVVTYIKSEFPVSPFGGDRFALKLQTMVYLANLLPTRAHGGDTPYTLWYGNDAKVSHLPKAGCKAFEHKEQPERDPSGQMNTTVEEGKIVRYCANSPSFRALRDGTTLVTSRNVTFLEKSPHTKTGARQNQNGAGNSRTPGTSSLDPSPV